MFLHAGYCFHIALLIDNGWNDTVWTIGQLQLHVKLNMEVLLSALSDNYCLLRKKNKKFYSRFLDI